MYKVYNKIETVFNIAICAHSDVNHIETHANCYINTISS